MASSATNRIFKLLLPMVAVLALAMCDEGDPVEVDPDIATIEVTPGTTTLNAVGATAQLNAVALDAGGSTISGVTFSWSSDASGVATVSNTGQVTAQGDGQAQISAQAQGVTGTATVTVAIEVDEVVVTPAEASIETGASTTFAADVLDANGNAVAGATVSWSSSDEAVATIDENGEATGLSSGTTTITAESDGVSGTATLTVVAPVASVEVTPAATTLDAVGATVQLTATVLDEDGETVENPAVTWSSDDDAVATVDEDGLVTAQGDGEAQISAQVQDVTGTATVTVAVEVNEVVVTPAEASIETGASTTFAADVLDANGNAVAGATVSWSSSDEAVATIDQNGEATGQSSGTTTITAESDGVSGTATLTVTAPVASVEVTPATTTLNAIGATAQLSTTVLDEDGETVENPSVTWSSDDDAVATVDGDGLVTAAGDGTATITATVGSVSGTATVTVAQEAASVSVSPAEASVEVDETVTFTAQAEDANGNEVPGATFTWSSDNEAVATVDSEGVATGVAEGTATITAMTGGVSGTASLTVTAAAGAPSLSMVSGDGQFGKTEEDFDAPLVVEVTDDSGDPVSGITVTWDVTSGTGTLSTESVVTNSQGQASVTVTSGRNTGDQVVEASAEGTEGGPVTFNLRTSVIVVDIGDNYFEDTQGRRNGDFEINIEVGDTVEWKYLDNQSSVHTVTSDSNPAGGSTFDSDNMSPGDTFRWAPGIAGTWTFFCEIHPAVMIGSTINVTDPAGTPRREDGDGTP